MVKLINVSNPAAFGVEWTDGDNGSRFQLANPRGTETLMFGMKNDSEGRNWSTMAVTAPDRFGMTRAPRTFAEFRKVAESYTAND